MEKLQQTDAEVTGSKIEKVGVSVTEDLQVLRESLRENTTGELLWGKYKKVFDILQNALEVLTSLGLPVGHRPRLLMQTDKGPGVSITNHEVKFRDAELVQLYNLDWQLRIHLAVNDPCPAERTNACIGNISVLW